MKVLILYSTEYKTRYHELKRLLGKFDVPVFPYEADKTKESDSKNIDLSLCRKLSKSTHTILIISDDVFEEQWFSFAAGFSLGRKETSLLYMEDKSIAIPDYLKSFLRVSSPETIEKHFERESHQYRYQKEVHEAKMNLVDEGIPVSTRGFFEVVRGGDLIAVKHFLTAGFSPDLKNKKGVPLITEAVRNGHEEIMRELLSCGADVKVKSDDNGNTPLMDAASKGNETMLNEIISAGADLDEQSKNGQTALILTVGIGSYSMTQTLLQAGAEPSISDKLGMTARKYAELFKHKEIIDALSQVLSS